MMLGPAWSAASRGRRTFASSRHALLTHVAALGVGLASLLVATGAHADTPAQRPLRLAVRPNVCTREAGFWDALARRTPRVRSAMPGESAPLVTIDIGRDGARVVGRLWIADTEGQRPAARVVTGESCDEVVATMSLMTALVFDPEASAPPRASPATPPAPAPPTPAAPPPAPPTPAAPPTPPAPPAEIPMHWSVAAGGRGAMATMGDLAFGGGLFVDLERISEAHPTTAWLASFRLTASFSLLDISAAPVHGNATWRVVDLDLCPWRAAVRGLVSFRPCASLEGGTLDINATGVRDAHPFTRPWLAPGVRAQLNWSILDPVLVGLDAAAAIPLIRDEFTIEPVMRLFRAPVVTASFGAFLGVRFL